MQLDAYGGLRFEPFVGVATHKYMVFLATITQDKVGDADLGIALRWHPHIALTFKQACAALILRMRRSPKRLDACSFAQLILQPPKALGSVSAPPKPWVVQKRNLSKMVVNIGFKPTNDFSGFSQTYREVKPTLSSGL